MTDAENEKIERIVEWMGGWPKHELHGAERCPRCLITLWDDDEECYAFNPFERIEDAFLVVEHLKPISCELFCNELDGAWRCCMGREGSFEVLSGFWQSPASAITEAACHVVEKLKLKAMQ